MSVEDLIRRVSKVEGEIADMRKGEENCRLRFLQVLADLRVDFEKSNMRVTLLMAAIASLPAWILLVIQIFRAFGKGG